MYEIVVGGEVFGKEDKTGLYKFNDPVTARNKFREIILAQLIEWAMGEVKWQPVELQCDGKPVVVVRTPKDAVNYLGKSVVMRYLEKLKREIDGSDELIQNIMAKIESLGYSPPNYEEAKRIVRLLWSDRGGNRNV